MLKICDVDVDIEASRILRKVTLEAAPGELVCLVGRNGASKTTTLRTVRGYRRPAAGTVTLDGETIHGRPTHAIAARGVGIAACAGRREGARGCVRGGGELAVAAGGEGGDGRRAGGFLGGAVLEGGPGGGPQHPPGARAPPTITAMSTLPLLPTSVVGS